MKTAALRFPVGNAMLEMAREIAATQDRQAPRFSG
jgi:hypothetical protein